MDNDINNVDTLNTAGEETQKPDAIKKYNFVSAAGANMLAPKLFVFTDSTVKTEVRLYEDRLEFDILPKRFNKVPLVYLSDIKVVDVGKKIHTLTWLRLFASLVLAVCTVGLGLILTVIVLVGGVDNVVTVYCKDGRHAVFFSGDKAAAEQFRQDIEQIKRQLG